jgi:protein ImuB
MLWLCITFPQLPLEALCPDDASQPLVVTECEGNTRWILCCNSAAEAGGLKAGMNYTTGLAMLPHVRMLERKPLTEHSALLRLGGWAYQFSSQVICGEVPPELRHARSSCVWLEIGASLKLFGGFRSFLERFEMELQQLEYSYLLGVGPTLEGAALLARSEIRLAITTPHALFTRIRHLPLSKLLLAPEIVKHLHASGVRTIGLLLELPRDGLAKRFGPGLTLFLARLTGDMPDPRPAFKLPNIYDAKLEFDFEIRSTESLLFPLRRMLREFVGFLRARDICVQRFSVTLAHRDHPATQLVMGLSVPDRNADRFFAIVREQLERTALAAPTIELNLSADQFSAPTGLQTDLLSSSIQQTEDFSHTLDRIVARLGTEHVHRLKVVADHRPESSWTAPSSHEDCKEAKSLPPVPDRPLWLLPEPKPLQLSVIPKITSGPERIEAGWWDTSDVQRDYYIVRTSNGADLWIYRDLSDRGGWFLHGFWS